MSFEKKEITVEQFLKKCAKSMIHEKYYLLVERATEAFEAEKENLFVAHKVEDSSSDENEFDENIMAIFATEQTTSKRVRKLCTKYFGGEWVN